MGMDGCLAADESREREQMKNTTLTITFNTEKLDALFFHMGKGCKPSGRIKRHHPEAL